MPTTGDAELLRALLADLDPIIVRLVDKIREEIDSFQAVPIEEQHFAAGASVRLLILELLGESEGDPAARDAVAGLGERRAEQGVPVEDVLRAWRIGVDHVIFEARKIAERDHYRPETVFDLLQEALATADEAMVSLAEGHREADEPAEADDPQRSREAFLLAALGGEAGVAELRNQATSLGLELSAPQRAFRAPGAGEQDLTRIRGMLEAGGEIRGLAMIAAGELVGFVAGEPPRGAVELLAVGPAAPFEDLPQSFRIAGRVAAAAQAFSLAGVHDIQSAGLHVAVLESGDVGQALIERYVAPVRGSSSGEELLASVRAYLECNAKIDPAAQRLHVHPNTLRYRIGRFEELTGAELTETEQTVGIWWALHRDELDQLTADSD